jgi:mRNA-degrading endonuclease RelE of RelBE toxin-antitoxin system
MKLSVEYTDKAVKDLQKLGRPVAQKIVQKIRFYSEENNLFKHAKKLQPPFENLYRFRVGVYRAIFMVGKKHNITLITILKVSNRKDMYM